MKYTSRRAYIGVDRYGEYTYYDIIDYDECYCCKHFYDNEYYERFECNSEYCYKDNNDT